MVRVAATAEQPETGRPMNPDIVEKVLACQKLPSLPAVAVKVLELSGKENVSFKEIAETITSDAGLASKVLRTVNSSFYALRKPCSSINQAIVMLGLSAVKTLALGFSLVSSIAKTESKSFDYAAYWRRSLYTGVAAKCVAAAAKIGRDEEAFLGGLLQDVGMVALSQALGDEYLAVLTEAGPDHNNLSRVEFNAYEMTHADIGAQLAGRWKLPPDLMMPIKFHHKPNAAPKDYAQLCAAVALGNKEQVVDILRVERGKDRAAPRVRDGAGRKPFVAIGVVGRLSFQVLPGDLGDPRLGAVDRRGVGLKPHAEL